MDKTKVVSIITDLNTGGAGKVLQNFLSHCNYDEFEHWVVVPEGSNLVDILKDKGARIIAYEKLQPKSLSLKSILPLLRLLKKLEPDIVHAHACLSARIAATINGKCKVIYTRHCVFPPSGFSRSVFGRLIGRLVFLLFADKAIAISPAAKNNLAATGVPDNKTDVMMNGSEPLRKMQKRSILKKRESLGISEEEFVFIMVGRLVDIKGHRYFLKAADKVLKNNKEARFMIVGRGEKENELKRLAENSGEKVIFTGFTTDVAKYVNIADVFVNVSYGTEASSLAIIEAMSIGKPVIASDYGGNPYQVEDGKTGIIVPVKNADALAQAMIEIMKDKTMYNNMSKKAKDEYRSKYTAKKMTDNIEEIYKKLVKKNV